MLTLADLLERKGKGAVTVPESASVGTAIRTMHLHRVGSVLVPSDDGLPKGIFTERDVLHLYANGNSDFETLLVKECMTTQLVLGSPADPMDEVLAIMTEKRFRHMPVIQDGQIIGVISIGDLVKAKLEATAVEAEALRQYIHS